MYRYAVVNNQGEVVNVIVWDGQSSWQPPKDHYVVKHDSVDIHDKWDHEKKELKKGHFRKENIQSIIDEGV